MPVDEVFKIILIVLDGIADCAYPQLKNLTPLQYANTPNLDYYSLRSSCGLMYPISPGIAPGTELAHFLLFGYKNFELPLRGVLEANGEGIELIPGQVACRVSLAFVKREETYLKIVERHPSIGVDVCKNIFDKAGFYQMEDITIKLVYTDKNQGIITLDGPVSQDITDSDPFQNELPVLRVQPMEKSENHKNALRTADALNKYLAYFHAKACQIMKKNNQKQDDGTLPFLLTKWAGLKKQLPTFKTRNGLVGATIASSAILRGLTKEINLDYFYIKQESDSEADLSIRLNKALDISSKYEFIHIHSKLADEASHRFDPLLKVSVIEGFDRAIDDLEKKFPEEKYVVILTSDHASPCWSKKIHSGEAVPVLVKGKYTAHDRVESFNEVDCALGSLSLINCQDVLPLALNYSGRTKLASTRPLAQEVIYRPVNLKPFPLDYLE